MKIKIRVLVASLIQQKLEQYKSHVINILVVIF